MAKKKALGVIVPLSSCKIRALSMSSGALKDQLKQKIGRASALPAPPPARPLVRDNRKEIQCFLRVNCLRMELDSLEHLSVALNFYSFAFTVQLASLGNLSLQYWKQVPAILILLRVIFCTQPVIKHFVR